MKCLDPAVWLALIGRSLFASAGSAAGSLPSPPLPEPRIEIGERTPSLPIAPEGWAGASPPSTPGDPVDGKPPPFDVRRQAMGPGPFGAPHALAALVLDVLAHRTRERALDAHGETRMSSGARP